MLEGIALSLKVEFKFVKVLRSILEEEGLVREAYIEEIKSSIEKVSKGLNDAITVAPILRTYLEQNMIGNHKSRHGLIAGSILSSSVFIGSSIIMQSNPLFAQIGFVIAAAIIGSSLFIDRFR